MNKEFIPYEQALELKELGFDEPCFSNLQEFPNIVNTKFIEGERKTFYTWSCYSCRKEIISYQTE